MQHRWEPVIPTRQSTVEAPLISALPFSAEQSRFAGVVYPATFTSLGRKKLHVHGYMYPVTSLHSDEIHSSIDFSSKAPVLLLPDAQSWYRGRGVFWTQHFLWI